MGFSLHWALSAVQLVLKGKTRAAVDGLSPVMQVKKPQVLASREMIHVCDSRGRSLLVPTVLKVGKAREATKNTWKILFSHLRKRSLNFVSAKNVRNSQLDYVRRTFPPPL